MNIDTELNSASARLAAHCVALQNFVYSEERSACVAAAADILNTITERVKALPSPAVIPGTLIAHVVVTPSGGSLYTVEYCPPGPNPHRRFQGGSVMASIVIAVFALGLQFDLTQAEAQVAA